MKAEPTPPPGDPGGAGWPGPGADRTTTLLDDLRRRSRQRVWLRSAQVALRRGQAGEPGPWPEDRSSRGEEP